MLGEKKSEGRRFTDAGDTEGTVVGRGIRINGELTGSAPVEVWGAFEGTLKSQGLVQIRQEGEVNGDIHASNIVVEGQVEGGITAREKVELRASCQVHGDIEANTVAMADGALFEGRVRMVGNERRPAPSQVQFKEKRKPGD